MFKLYFGYPCLWSNGLIGLMELPATLSIYRNQERWTGLAYRWFCWRPCWSLTLVLSTHHGATNASKVIARRNP
ncbi:hypothetical protein GWI33_015318 [Rhynchophorus ferrugineus]|uniref:Uncharacterized protein n=1 Tax=Rhynchophorus ferrugineus TaxID=354439 RepID=A0A834I567_RHYFE|nr:hypothetical protein GWI33_015318 [Rhynchophorus ferrugineus]